MTPADILNKRFEKGMTGYKTDEVNAWLADVSQYVEDILRDRDELQEKLELLAERLEDYRADEDSLRAALIGAQKLGDSVVRESKKQAEELLTEATNKAEAILAEASHKADSLVGDAKRNIDTEAYALSKMKLEVAKFKTQILNMYKKHVEMINAIPYEENKLPPLPERPAGTASKVDLVDTSVIDESMNDASDIQLDYEEVTEADGFPKRKSSKFGKLQFGEEYNLTRNN